MLYCPYCGTKVEMHKIESKIRKFCPNCQTYIYENPVPVVAIVIFNDKNELLLIKRKEEPAKGEWALPSGFIELNEQPQDAAKRELFEETRINARELKLIDVFEQKSKKYKSVLVLAYIGFTKDQPVAGDDAEEAKFFATKNLPQIPFESHIRAIRKSLELLKGYTPFLLDE